VKKEKGLPIMAGFFSARYQLVTASWTVKRLVSGLFITVFIKLKETSRRSRNNEGITRFGWEKGENKGDKSQS